MASYIDHMIVGTPHPTALEDIQESCIRVEIDPAILEDWKKECRLKENRKIDRTRKCEKLVTTIKQGMPPCGCNTVPALLDPPIPIKRVLAAVQSYAELCILVRNATVHLSFWGGRYIKVEGYKGSLPIDALAARVLVLLKYNPNFDEGERSHGKRMAPLIDHLYNQTHRCNLITYLLYKIRRLISYIFSSDEARFLWQRMAANPIRTMKRCGLDVFECNHHEGYNKIFNYYTKSQYKTTFQTLPEHFPDLYVNGQGDWYSFGEGSVPPHSGIPSFIPTDLQDYLWHDDKDRKLPPSLNDIRKFRL